MVVQGALANARQALAYFVRGQEWPAASFPPTAQLPGLLDAGDPDSLAPGMPVR